MGLCVSTGEGCSGAGSGVGTLGCIGVVFGGADCCALFKASCSSFCRAASSSCFFAKASASRFFRKASSSSLLRRASSSCCFLRRASSSLFLCCSSHSRLSRSCRASSSSGVLSEDEAGFGLCSVAGGGIAIGSEDPGGFFSSSHLEEVENWRCSHLRDPLAPSVLLTAMDAWRN